MTGGHGRPRRRGVRRVRRNVTIDGPVEVRLEQLAQRAYGGNFSAALQAVVERGLAELDAAEQLAAGRAALLRQAGLAGAMAEVDRLTRPPADDGLRDEHLRSHLVDGRWHDACRFCQRRRETGGTGVPG